MPGRGTKVRVTRRLIMSLCAVVLSVPLAACSGGGAEDNASAPSASGAAVADALQTYCSGCHGPPSPQAHSPDEWPAVVARMQQRRAQKGMAAIPPAARAEILRTLQGSGSDGAGST